jgi:hypothetical protein
MSSVVHGEREALLAAVEDGLQALALDELVRDVEGRVDLADAEQLDDVGILQLGRELHLVHQALHRLRVRGEVGPDAEHRDDLLEAGRAELGGAVLRAETGGLDLFEEHELSELLFLGHGGRPSSALSFLAPRVAWKISRAHKAFNVRVSSRA